MLLLLLWAAPLVLAQKVECPEGSEVTYVTLTGGLNDNFKEETEPAHRGAELDKLAEAWADFDEQKSGLSFGFTFEDLPCGTVVGATLRFYAAPLNGKDSPDDTLSVGYDGRGWTYTDTFENITRRSWVRDPAWITLELTAQQLELFLATGRLDMLVVDATSVDYAELILAICSITDCNDNCVDDKTDIASGYSQDVNGNGVPDECEVILPELICPPSVVVIAGVDCCGNATLTPTVVNVAGDYALTNNIDPNQTGSLTYCFPVGVNTVTFTLDDYIHAPISCTTTVIVIDNQGPVIMPRQQ
jgi:hypothetical protein